MPGIGRPGRKELSMKVIIAGSRPPKDILDNPEQLLAWWSAMREYVDQAMQDLIRSGVDVDEIISGAAAGPDTIGVEWAVDNKRNIYFQPALWYVGGKKNLGAGHRRNAVMGKKGDILVAFSIGKSAGTENMIQNMSDRKKPAYVYRFNSHSEIGQVPLPSPEVSCEVLQPK